VSAEEAQAEYVPDRTLKSHNLEVFEEADVARLVIDMYPVPQSKTIHL